MSLELLRKLNGNIFTNKLNNEVHNQTLIDSFKSFLIENHKMCFY